MLFAGFSRSPERLAPAITPVKAGKITPKTGGFGEFKGKFERIKGKLSEI
jgi:hypothetical protein